jgi:hypothetical protein
VSDSIGDVLDDIEDAAGRLCVSAASHALAESVEKPPVLRRKLDLESIPRRVSHRSYSTPISLQRATVAIDSQVGPARPLQADAVALQPLQAVQYEPGQPSWRSTLVRIRGVTAAVHRDKRAIERSCGRYADHSDLLRLGQGSKLTVRNSANRIKRRADARRWAQGDAVLPG